MAGRGYLIWYFIYVHAHTTCDICFVVYYIGFFNLTLNQKSIKHPRFPRGVFIYKWADKCLVAVTAFTIRSRYLSM